MLVPMLRGAALSPMLAALAIAASCSSSGSGAAALGPCHGGCLNGYSECTSDQGCPATQHNYVVNGTHCVTVCKDQLCRTPCTSNADCGSLSCSAIADDGTRFCDDPATQCSH